MFSFSSEGLYAFKGYLCDGDPLVSSTFCQVSFNVQAVQVGGTKQAIAVTAPTDPGATPGSDGELPSYPVLTDEEYARQEMAAAANTEAVIRAHGRPKRGLVPTMQKILVAALNN